MTPSERTTVHGGLPVMNGRQLIGSGSVSPIERAGAMTIAFLDQGAPLSVDGIAAMLTPRAADARHAGTRVVRAQDERLAPRRRAVTHARGEHGVARRRAVDADADRPEVSVRRPRDPRVRGAAVVAAVGRRAAGAVAEVRGRIGE